MSKLGFIYCNFHTAPPITTEWLWKYSAHMSLIGDDGDDVVDCGRNVNAGICIYM
jgi:hypothetical protein